MRKLVFAAVAALAAAALSVGIAWSVTPGAAHRSARQPVHRVIWMGAGPSESCGPNDCGGGVGIVPFHMPGSGTYVASVTMSFQYRATGNAKFGIAFPLGRHRVLPKKRALGPSAAPTTTTLVFRTHLRGGRDYQFAPRTSVSGSSGNYSITTGKVMIEVDATPSSSHAKLAMHPHVLRRTVQRSR
jgi:hypothetical protein